MKLKDEFEYPTHANSLSYTKGRIGFLCQQRGVILNDYIDNEFKDSLSSMFDDTEIVYIEEFFDYSERIKYGFILFSLIEPKYRVSEARAIMDIEPRTGFISLSNIPQAQESVADHQQACRDLAFILYSDLPECYLIADVAEIHDMEEAITGDLILSDLPFEDKKLYKKMIGNLSTRLLTVDLDFREQRVFDACKLPEIKKYIKELDSLQLNDMLTYIISNAPDDDKQRIKDVTAAYRTASAPFVFTEKGQDYLKSCLEQEHKDGLGLKEILYNNLIQSSSGGLGTNNGQHKNSNNCSPR